MVGCCTFPPSEIVESHWVADRRGHVPFRCNQPPYSIFVRGIEREVLPVCDRYGMGVITWSPLNSGWLTGRYRRGVENPVSPRATIAINRPREADESSFGRARPTYTTLHDYEAPANQRKLDLVEGLAALAAEAGISMVHLAIGFVLAHRHVTSAIIGPRTMEQVLDQLPFADRPLDDDVLDRIDALVPPGTDLFAGDAGYQPPALLDPRLRRG
jgi:aryl-alcohol dehydrogenase (NADP+)